MGIEKFNNLFYGTVNNGKLKFDAIFKLRFKELLERFEGKKIIFGLDKQKDLRTVSQNKYYWGVLIDGVAQETGQDPESIHDHLKDKFLRIPMEINGKRYYKVKSTSSLSTNEFIDYVENCRQYVQQEFGLFVPLPGEIDESLLE